MNERKEKVKGLEATWALARMCKRIIKESESDWDDRREKIRKNLEEFEEHVKRKERLDNVEQKKEVIKKRHTQSRINVMLSELSNKGAEEWKKIESEEEKLERLELKEIKENLWRWRTSTKKYKREN